MINLCLGVPLKPHLQPLTTINYVIVFNLQSTKIWQTLPMWDTAQLPQFALLSLRNPKTHPVLTVLPSLTYSYLSLGFFFPNLVFFLLVLLYSVCTDKVLKYFSIVGI